MVTARTLIKNGLSAAASLAGAPPTGLRNTGRVHLGPATINFGRDALPTSITVGAGPVRMRAWDRQGHQPGISSIDLPGPYSYRPTPKKRTQTVTPDTPVTTGTSEVTQERLSAIFRELERRR